MQNSLTGAERQKKYKENNQKKVELNQLKQNIRRQNLKYDADKAAEAREAGKKRKAEYRARKKALDENKENNMDLSDVTLASDDTDTNQNDTSNASDHNSSFKTPKRRRDISSDSSFLSSNEKATPSRQHAIGQQIRKKNYKLNSQKYEDLVDENNDLKAAQDKHDDILVELDLRIRELEATEEKLENRIRELENEKEKNDEWLCEVYKNLTADGKKQFKTAFAVSSHKFKKGTISRLRKTTGINFSNPLPQNIEEPSEIKLKIVEFAKNNTIDVPDKKKYVKGIRYRTASLLSLYNTFESENPNICTYQTFCKYWPALFVKPSPSEFGTCLCTYCQNIELKVSALQNRKLVSQYICIENIIENTRNGDFTLENQFREDIESLADEDKKDIDVAFLVWEKVKQTEISKNTGRVKGDKMMRVAKHLKAIELGKKTLEEFEVYKEHLERDYIMKSEIKKVRIEASEDDDLAVLHIDWAEQHKLTEVKEIQSAFFNGRYAYDIHTGYCYTKEDSHGFASLSDCSDHKAEAIHSALKDKIVKLVENGKKRIVICSDSPSSQYRNSKNVFLMKRIAQELNITIRLLFTEAGHGKSPCDGVGGNIKTQVESVMLESFGKDRVETIHSVEDVAKVIKEKTNLTYHISIHTKENIEQVKKSMPKLSSLLGAMKVHEVLISENGVIKKKDLPTDTFYKQVTIRESRIRRIHEPEAEDVHADQEMVETQDVHANQENIETEGAHNIAFSVENTSDLPRRIQTRAEIAELLEADDDCDDSDDDDDSDW
jgi:hypothetical protein